MESIMKHTVWICAVTFAALLSTSSVTAASGAGPRDGHSPVYPGPGTGQVMIEMGFRYQNLYHAAKQGRWQFAAYQLEEMGELLEQLGEQRPAYTIQTNRVAQQGLLPVELALRDRHWSRFAERFDQLRQSCERCHIEQGHPYIKLPIPEHATSPVLAVSTAE
jgi:hypothetical protein